ncbi:MAG: serine hydrolase domain-containing protein [Caldimonas sp.]
MTPDPFDPAPSPTAAGFDEGRLGAIDAMLLDQVKRGALPGAVTLIVRRGVVAAFSALGSQDPQRDLPMARDSIFRIYSMTKPIVSVALMKLVEQGRLLLSDPVARQLPEFGRSMLHATIDGNRASSRPHVR